jgi:hypothetical protein
MASAGVRQIGEIGDTGWELESGGVVVPEVVAGDALKVGEVTDNMLLALLVVRSLSGIWGML